MKCSLRSGTHVLACSSFVLLAGCGPSRDVFFAIDGGLDAPRFDAGLDAPSFDAGVDAAAPDTGPDIPPVQTCEEGIARMQQGAPCSLGEGLLCTVPRADCRVFEGYCSGGVFEIRERSTCDCMRDEDCPSLSYCEDNTCVPCTTTTDPNALCPECGGIVLPRVRNGCVTECVCGSFECDPSAPGACGGGAVRCAVSSSCLSGCARDEPGCCASACVEDSCPEELPVGCEMPCPFSGSCGGSACSAQRCSCSRGRWLCAPGCGAPLPGCRLPCDLQVTFDCRGGVTREQFAACASSRSELHVVGQRGSAGGTVEVVVDRPGSQVFLGLVSAAPTHWNVTVGEGTSLSGVFLDGEGASSVTLPEALRGSVSTLDRTGPMYDFACAYELPGAPPCDTPGLLIDLAAQIGLDSAASFTGCEEGRRFVLGTIP